MYGRERVRLFRTGWLPVKPIELKPASFKTEFATTEFKSTIAAKTQKPSSARARDRAHLAMKTTKSTAAADSDTTQAGIADSRPEGVPLRIPIPERYREQVAASTAVAEQATAAKPVPAPEQKANNTDRSGHAETVLRGDAEKTAAASPNNTDHLVALLIARRNQVGIRSNQQKSLR